MNYKLLKTNSSKTTILIRLMVGSVFLSEGIQKFIFPAIRGAGRLEKIGFPYSDFLGTFVGASEIIFGSLILLGLLTRVASLQTLIIMIVAILTTKAQVLEQDGFWYMMHGSRTDWAMLLGSLFLIVQGGGKWSVDLKLSLEKNIQNKSPSN